MAPAAAGAEPLTTLTAAEYLEPGRYYGIDRRADLLGLGVGADRERRAQA